MTRRLLAAALLASACTSLPVLAQAQRQAPARRQAPAPAQNSRPQPVPFVDTIPAARDIAYPGTLSLEIDATNIRQGIFSARETIPVAAAGHTVLLYPKWLPGKHAARGEIEKLVDLVVRGNGRIIPWTRDTVDVFAFHLDVPAGVKTLDVSLKFASATQGNQGRIVMTPNMMSLQFNSMSLYPAGYFTRQIPIKATVTYPAGWTAATALRGKVNGATYAYETVDYDTLVDSPVLAGRYGKTWVLSPRVNLNVYADKPEELNAKPEQIDAYKRAVVQAVKVFGAEHYDHYDFLQAITADLGGIGLEHHRSTEISSPLGFFGEWDSKSASRNVVTHEYAHSWDGKFRRGADLWTPDFRVPMRDSLLWVYEGQTQFWGTVLQARAGLGSKQDVLDSLAMTAASLDTAPGRQWRPMVDTTNDPILSARGAKGWVSNQRSEDYYRGAAGVDGGRFAAAPGIGRQEVDRRFRPRVLRPDRWRLGRGDVHVRRRGEHVERHPAL
jgi:predicted metalloprotease with PDZ domain